MNKKIFVTGASGFLGLALCRRLMSDGYDLRAWTHHEETAKKIASARCETTWGDLNTASDLDLFTALDGVEAIVHAAAATSEKPISYEESKRLNVDVTARLLKLCEKKKTRFIFISSQSAKITSPSVYGATKREAEELVLKSPVGFVVRPPIIYGPGAGGLFSKFTGLVRKFPIVPVPSAPVRFRPIYVDDVVEVIIKCFVLNPHAPRAYDIAGPDAVTLPELIREIAAELKLHRQVVPIPLWILILVAKTLELGMTNPPITTSNIVGMKEETRIDTELAETVLNFKPRRLREGLREMFAAG